MKRFLVLGSGNAFHIDGRGHASYWLEHEDGQILLMDFGASGLLRLQQERLPIEKIHSILLTHFHGDHCAGLPFLFIYMEYVLQRKEKVTILGPEGVDTQVHAMNQLFYPGVEFSFRIEFKILSPNEILLHDGFTIDPRKITHRPESLGYRIHGNKRKILAFSGDTVFDSHLLELFHGVDAALVELSFEKSPEKSSHVSLEEIRRERKSIQCKTLYFTHTMNSIAKLVADLSKNDPTFGNSLVDGQWVYL